MGTTETLEKQAVIANFLHTDQKKMDWRYSTSDSMSNKSTSGYKKIYWIGIVDLRAVDENQKEYPLHFINDSCCLKDDREFRRDTDGEPSGIIGILYNLSDILPALISARKMGSNYVHILVEEKVDAGGRSIVNILVSKEKTGADILKHTGFQSDKPWIELGTLYTYWLSQIDISDLERICIRSTRAYNWLK